MLQNRLLLCRRRVMCSRACKLCKFDGDDGLIMVKDEEVSVYCFLLKTFKLNHLHLRVFEIDDGAKVCMPAYVLCAKTCCSYSIPLAYLHAHTFKTTIHTRSHTLIILERHLCLHDQGRCLCSPKPRRWSTSATSRCHSCET